MLLVLLAGWGSRAAAQISPGPLARPHERLEGSLRCRECHAGRDADGMSGLCAGCHREVGWMVSRRRGLHGRDPGKDCASCHPDHAGREFALVSWAEGAAERFDHRRAGWALEQSHRTLDCADCHTAKFRRSPAAALAPRGAAPRWIGLEASCASCHTDVHRGALAADCLDCHDQREWKPAPRFTHDSTDYPLTGKHADVACNDCHAAARVATRRTPAGDTIPVYRDLPHAECSACHADPHKGGLGATCADCHLTSSFAAVNRQGFAHERTRYPLRGRHAAVKCEGCHDFSIPRGRRPAFATCGTCHQDPHEGSATLAGKPADCDACHGLAGFTPATYTVARHATTRYPLEGRHRQVRCGGCHESRPRGGRTVMRPPAGRCLDCHADDHGGQLASRTGGAECRDCHDVGGWRPTTFEPARHAAAGLPLSGRHAQVECSACHGADRKGLRPLPAGRALGKARVAVVLPERRCGDCHVDAHAGRYPETCADCHDAEKFAPSTVGVAAHAAFRFPLEGAHRAVPCPACHKPARVETGRRETRRPVAKAGTLIALAGHRSAADYTLADLSCAGCHDTPHGAQFGSRADRGACEACHGLDAFAPADRFDHDRDARFPLRGAHAPVACDKCHVPPRAGAAVVYRPLSAECSSCHTDLGRRS